MKLSILFLFFSTISYAQYKTSPLLKAESLIIEGDMCEAAKLYYNESKSISLWDFDLINGLLTSLECNDSLKIRYFIDKLFEIGAPIEYFENDLSQYHFFKTDEWKNIKENKPYFNRDNDVIKAISEMIRIDQSARNSDKGYERADFEVKMKLDSLVRKNGFPTQKDLGFDYPPKALMNGRDFNVILIHQIKSRPYGWGEILPKLYKDKKISRRQFVFLSAFIKTCDKIQLTCFPFPAENVVLIDNQIYTCCCKNAEKINNTRRKFGLESLEMHFKKSLFKMNSNIPFRIGKEFPTFSPGDNKTLIKKLKTIGIIPYNPK